MNYEANRKYFSKDPSVSGFVGMMLVGIVLALLGSGALCWTGVAVTVIGFIFICIAISGRPSDAEIEAQAKAMFNNLDKRAFKKLGIDPSEVSLAEPIRFWGYRFADSGLSVLGDEANDEALWVIGEDGKSRSSEVAITGFYFGENSVYCYERIASLVSDSSKESTEEYFYKDIVSVKTDSIDIKKNEDNKGKMKKNVANKRIRSEVFMLTNMGGERRKVPVTVTAEAEAAVSAFRTLLKQKKL